MPRPTNYIRGAIHRWFGCQNLSQTCCSLFRPVQRRRMRRLFILSFLVIALVTAGKLPGSNDPNNLKPSASGPSKRSPYLNPMTSYLRKMVDQEDNLAGRSVLSARELVRGARFLFWRFSLTTVTSYTATSTSTSTTTCTLSTSSTCTGRRRRSFLEHPEDDNKDESPANIIPSTVLKYVLSFFFKDLVNNAIRLYFI